MRHLFRHALLLMTVTLGWGGCEDAQKPRPVPAARPPLGSYPDGPAGVQRLWEDILSACRKDDRERVHELIASMALSKEQLAGLIGAEAAVEGWPSYQFQVGSMANAGAVELVAFVYDKKLDEVVVQRADALPAAEQGATDKAVLRRLKQPHPIYTVTLRRKPAQKGLRYESLIYVDGRWRTLAPLGKSG